MAERGGAEGSRLLSLSFGVKINFILGLGLAILVAVGSIALRSVEALIDAGRDEGQSFSEVSVLERVIGTARRAESAGRRFALTGDAADLERYRSTRALLGQANGELEYVGNEIEQRRRILQLRAVINDRMERLDELVSARQKRGAVAAAEVVRAGRGEEASLRMQILADQFRDREVRRLRALRGETEVTAENTSFLIFWGMAFAFMLLLWAMVIIHRHQAARRHAEEALKASEAQLRLITDTVPALIGYVNREGRLLFHNRAFEQWFGRSAEDLRQRTLASLMGENEYAKVAAHIGRVLGGEPVSFDFPLDMGPRGMLHLSVQLVPRFDARGVVSGYYTLATDISVLKEVDRLKSEFVTTVSHELRTPLTSIRGSLGLLAAGVTGVLPDKARQLVAIAVQNCERLVRLVNDILDSEKMLSGKMEYKIAGLDLLALLRRSVTETEGYATQHGVSVRLNEVQGTLPVQADSDRLVQVVTNLVSNACKFSPKGGVVEIDARCADGRVQVEVSDRGPGVPPELQVRLFERFAQLDSTDSRRRAGTGLGLNICRAIIEHLGGKIGFRERSGGGSVFWFELPAAAALPAQDSPAAAPDMLRRAQAGAAGQ